MGSAAAVIFWPLVVVVPKAPFAPVPIRAMLAMTSASRTAKARSLISSPPCGRHGSGASRERPQGHVLHFQLQGKSGPRNHVASFLHGHVLARFGRVSRLRVSVSTVATTTPSTISPATIRSKP